MHHYRKLACGIPERLLILSLFAFCILAGTAFAKKPPKTYPEEGRVIGTGTSGQATTAGLTMGSAPLTRTKYTHTYKVETATSILVLDCGKLPFFGSTGGECGGDKKIKLGDVIHFRIEKDSAYIPVTQTVPDDSSDPSNRNTHQEQDEQKLRILSQELKPDTAADKPQATQPGKD
jgi:hypothetical protein